MEAGVRVRAGVVLDTKPEIGAYRTKTLEIRATKRQVVGLSR